MKALTDKQAEQVIRDEYRGTPKVLAALDDFLGADAEYSRLMAELMAPNAPGKAA